jgi:hypothetical protein
MAAPQLILAAATTCNSPQFALPEIKSVRNPIYFFSLRPQFILREDQICHKGKN